MKTLSKVFIGGVVILIFFHACKKNEPCPPKSTQAANEIFLLNTVFTPAVKTIAKGTIIRWINKDPYAHTVTSSNNKFESGNLNEGQSFQFKFDTAGTYNYYCKYHAPNMAGKIIVN